MLYLYHPAERALIFFLPSSGSSLIFREMSHMSLHFTEYCKPFPCRCSTENSTCTTRTAKTHMIPKDGEYVLLFIHPLLGNPALLSLVLCKSAMLQTLMVLWSMGRVGMGQDGMLLQEKHSFVLSWVL